MDQFLIQVDSLLSKISTEKLDSYILTDSNINLLNLNSTATDYLDLIFSRGFLQTVCKASRMFNNHVSLIDHIITNVCCSKIVTGTIICDISDHFATFISPSLSKLKVKQPKKLTRVISKPKLENFRLNLSMLRWDEVCANNNVDESYEIFWNILKPLYNLHFPETYVRFNKNVHRINDFMTKGLLNSRNRKLVLQKISISDPTPANLNTYKLFRNIYTKTLRAGTVSYTHLRAHET